MRDQLRGGHILNLIDIALLYGRYGSKDFTNINLVLIKIYKVGTTISKVEAVVQVEL